MLPPRPPERRPWPMKWVIVAILLVIVPYTYLTLHFRKPGKAFEPYADMKDRATTKRLLSAGFQRITLPAQRPADLTRAIMVAPVNAAPGGVPEALRNTLLEQPRLPADVLNVSAPPSVDAGQPYPIQFTCAWPDDKRQLGGAQLYLRSGEIFVVPQFERVADGLLTRSRESVVLLTVPAGALKPGSYQATLIGDRASKSWTVQVH